MRSITWCQEHGNEATRQTFQKRINNAAMWKLVNVKHVTFTDIVETFEHAVMADQFNRQLHKRSMWWYYWHCMSVIMAESIRQPDELVLAGNIAESWRKCNQEFEMYLVATGLDTKTSKRKIALLLHATACCHEASHRGLQHILIHRGRR